MKPKIGAIIPARGGSKGIQRKNLAQIGGHPLIAWTINAAKASKWIDQVVVSTEDKEIASVARSYGAEVPFMRKAGLASDTTTGIDVVLDALDNMPDVQIAVLLQPTSPLRTTANIDEAVQLFFEKNAHSCVSIAEVKAHPDIMFSFDRDVLKLSPFMNSDKNLRRQDRMPLFQLNGAIYIAEREWLFANRSFISEDTIGYLMSERNSVDIDTIEDLLIAEHYIETGFSVQPETS